MKKFLSLVIIVCILLVSISAPTMAINAEDFQVSPVSQMTDVELLQFLEDYEIIIPEGLAESQEQTIDIIRSWVIKIEDNPDISVIYSLETTNDFVNALKDAVNDYYGIVSSSSMLPYASHGLRYSTVYDVPSNMIRYNCYSYALGRTAAIYHPGAFSGHAMTNSILKNLSVYQIASYVKEDLQSSSLGKSCVKITSARPTASSLETGQTAICVRKGDNGNGTYDYHFMRLYSTTWRHKPGITAILTYDYLPSTSRDWISEGYDGNRVLTGDVVYDSSIYYILFKTSHNYTHQYSGQNYHSGTKHYYEFADICSQCNSRKANSTTWTGVNCSGPPCIDIMSIGGDAK